MTAYSRKSQTIEVRPMRKSQVVRCPVLVLLERSMRIWFSWSILKEAIVDPRQKLIHHIIWVGNVLLLKIDRRIWAPVTMRRSSKSPHQWCKRTLQKENINVMISSGSISHEHILQWKRLCAHQKEGYSQSFLFFSDV